MFGALTTALLVGVVVVSAIRHVDRLPRGLVAGPLAGLCIFFVLLVLFFYVYLSVEFEHLVPIAPLPAPGDPVRPLLHATRRNGGCGPSRVCVAVCGCVCVCRTTSCTRRVPWPCRRRSKHCAHVF